MSIESKDVQTAPPASTDRPADNVPQPSDASAAPRKPYKKPNVARHGNLRMMTQLE